jgi:hypothetical protein
MGASGSSDRTSSPSPPHGSCGGWFSGPAPSDRSGQVVTGRGGATLIQIALVEVERTRRSHAVTTADEGEVAASDGRVEVLVAWWGGFVMGPAPALVVWWGSDRGTRTRSSARAAALYWVTALALWASVIVLFLTRVIANPVGLLVGAGVVGSVSVVVCAVATLRRVPPRPVLR